MGELGRIRAFEVTHGRKGTNNGWHPHYHFLQFCQVKADAAQLMDWRTRLYLRWDACCQRAGLALPASPTALTCKTAGRPIATSANGALRTS